MRWLTVTLLTTGLVASDYTASIQKWRVEREAKLKAPDGWLSLTGLTWLKPGENLVTGGVVILKGDRVTFRPAKGSETKPIQADSEEFVSVNGTKLFVIHRGQRYGIRVKDNQSQYRKTFSKLDWYPVDPSWRVTAKYIPFAEPRKKLFDSQTGDKQEMTIPGVVEFTRAGKTFRVSPILEEGELFFVFRDTTAGRTTYPAARFLYAKAPAKAGPVEVDFNKAYNPPCAFTPYATCPLPPRENRLDIPVEAGREKLQGCMALQIDRTVDGIWDDDGSRVLDIHTNAGIIPCRLHKAANPNAGIVWVFGAGGGLHGPADGMYTRLARVLEMEGWTSLRLDYRTPGHLMSCVLDVLAGMDVLEQMGLERIILVGHSFGGAVVISAGAASPSTLGVVAMSSQTAGTGAVDKLSPKPLLLMHGTADEVLPPSCSQEIYKRAFEPKKLRLYPGCGHGLDQCRETIDSDLLAWIRNVTVLRP